MENKYIVIIMSFFLLVFELLASAYELIWNIVLYEITNISEWSIRVFSFDGIKRSVMQREQRCERAACKVDRMVSVLMFSPSRVKFDWYCKKNRWNGKYLNILFKATQLTNEKIYNYTTL